MLELLQKLNFVTPTPVQHQAIPEALEGKDVVGVAQTGTGKTLAFGIPMIQRLVAEEGRAVVLVPTRELALQVHEVIEPFLKCFDLKSVVIIGGVSFGRQEKTLQKHPRVLIATPGRLNDHLEKKTVDLRDANLLVLDEADRMFDMGFKPQVERIMRQLAKKRQTLLFSATMPGDIVTLATRHMKLPIHVEIAPPGTAPAKLTQELYIVKEEQKADLMDLLLKQYPGSVLLFASTRVKVKSVTGRLWQLGYKVGELHSDRSMTQRQQAIDGFKNGQYRILVATDIAARGIDVTGIELVVNFDLPEDIENYVHRIGRTGRAGLEGRAISFATPEQRGEVARIESFMNMTLTIAEHPDFPTQSFEKRYNYLQSPSRRRRLR